MMCFMELPLWTHSILSRDNPRGLAITLGAGERMYSNTSVRALCSW